METLALHEVQTAVPVTLRVGQPTPQLVTDLAQFGQDVTLLVNGRIHLTLPQEDVLPKLADWLIQQGHTLYELTPQPITLEERFLQIVGDQSEG